MSILHLYVEISDQFLVINPLGPVVTPDVTLATFFINAECYPRRNMHFPPKTPRVTPDVTRSSAQKAECYCIYDHLNPNIAIRRHFFPSSGSAFDKSAIMQSNEDRPPGLRKK